MSQDDALTGQCVSSYLYEGHSLTVPAVVNTYLWSPIAVGATPVIYVARQSKEEESTQQMKEDVNGTGRSEGKEVELTGKPTGRRSIADILQGHLPELRRLRDSVT